MRWPATVVFPAARPAYSLNVTVIPAPGGWIGHTEPPNVAAPWLSLQNSNVKLRKIHLWQVIEEYRHGG
jgi:hypothetical protein